MNIDPQKWWSRRCAEHEWMDEQIWKHVFAAVHNIVKCFDWKITNED
jgi:hypothetical protein